MVVVHVTHGRIKIKICGLRGYLRPCKDGRRAILPAINLAAVTLRGIDYSPVSPWQPADVLDYGRANS